MKNLARSRCRLAVGIVAMVALVLAMTYVVVTTSRDDKATVTAMFSSASPLVVGNVVKMGGVEVGQISSIKLRGGRAEVEMTLNRSAAEIHEDARAKIRPVTLLGERYVDLVPGSANTPLMREPRMIPEGRTSRSVGIDDLLDSVDDPTGTALASLITTMGEGTAGEGTNIDAAIKALAPAMQDTARLGAVLDDQNDVLASLVDRSRPVAKALASGHGRDLDRLVSSSDAMLAAIRDKRAALDSTLRQLPATLHDARRTLAQVAGVSNAGAPVLRSVRPVTDNLSQVSTELNAFADSANPALYSLKPVLRKAKGLLDEAAPVARDLRPGGRGLNSVSDSADQLVGEVSKNFGTALDFVKFWALSTNGQDGISNYFRGVLVATPQSALQIPGVSLARGNALSAPGPDGASPGGVQGPPSPPGREAQPVQSDSPYGPGGQRDNHGSATGLDPRQEDALLGQLLGGQ